jgi:hypothetical protein
MQFYSQQLLLFRWLAERGQKSIVQTFGMFPFPADEVVTICKYAFGTTTHVL